MAIGIFYWTFKRTFECPFVLRCNFKIYTSFFSTAKSLCFGLAVVWVHTNVVRHYFSQHIPAGYSYYLLIITHTHPLRNFHSQETDYTKKCISVRFNQVILQELLFNVTIYYNCCLLLTQGKVVSYIS